MEPIYSVKLIPMSIVKSGIRSNLAIFEYSIFILNSLSDSVLLFYYFSLSFINENTSFSECSFSFLTGSSFILIDMSPSLSSWVDILFSSIGLVFHKLFRYSSDFILSIRLIGYSSSSAD